MTDTRCIRGGVVADPPEETGRLLALVHGRLEEARNAGRPVLKLEPEDVERLCVEAGIEGSAADSFGALVRQNLARLRGRWRENTSAVRAPVYVERITESGTRLLEGREEKRVRRSGAGHATGEQLRRGVRAQEATQAEKSPLRWP